MTRCLFVFVGVLFSGAVFAQDLLVNTRLQSLEYIEPNQSLTLQLADFFQRYDAPGPVATFVLHHPIPDEVRTLYTGRRLMGSNQYELLETDPLPRQTFLTQAESPYTHAFAVTGADFIWQTVEVQFQLLPEEAPITVANFMTYATVGDYTNTIVHRAVDRLPGEKTIVQAGGFALGENHLLRQLPDRGTIPLESTRFNTEGTLAMARSIGFDTATSQFFINLINNRPNFGNIYSVFGILKDPESSIQLLRDFSRADIFNLANFFPNLPFGETPLYAPYFEDPDNYMRIQEIRIPRGETSGIDYAWRFVTVGDEPTESELSNQASFGITIENGVLKVEPVDSGIVRIAVEGKRGEQTRSFNMTLLSYDRAALDVFPVSQIEPGGILVSSWYGAMNAFGTFPRIIHQNHGEQVILTAPPVAGIFIWDENLQSWLHTQIGRYPTLYHYGINRWIRYATGTGSGTGDERQPRWFYVWSNHTDSEDDPSGQWLREDDPLFQSH